jgi:uncharacterized protein involved in exopolysaccharide biosynthesis
VAALVFYSQTRRVYDSKAKILVSLGSEELGKAEYLSSKNLMLAQREQEIHNEQQILESQEVMTAAAKWILAEPTPGWSVPAMDTRLQKVRTYFANRDDAPTLVLGMLKTLGRWTARPKSQERELDDVRRQIVAGLSVKPVYNSDTLDVSFRFRNPDVAQTVLSLVIDAYLQHHIAVFRNDSEPDLLKAQLDRSVTNYHDQLDKFSAFMTAHRLYNDDTQANLLIDQREKLKQSLDESMAESYAASARLASLIAIQDSLRQLEKYSTTEVRNKERDALLARLNDAQLEEQAILTRHPKESRAYQEEEAKLNEIKSLVRQEPEKVIQETEQRKSKASELVDSEVISESEIERGSHAKIAELRGAIAELDGELNRYATDLKGFDALKLNVGFAKQESEQMAQVYAGSRLKALTSQRSITNVSIIDPPTLASMPSSPDFSITLAATMLLLAVGTFAVLFTSVAFDMTMADSATAERRLGLPVIETIPVVHSKGGAIQFPDAFTEENQREFARIYQSLREVESGGKIILLTESRSREGGSLVGYGLARFLGMFAGQKTAFIDRTAQPLNTLNTGVDPGTQQAAIEWPGVTPEERSGSGDSAGKLILASPSLNEKANGVDLVSMLTKMRQEFDYIVLAVGPAKESSDLLVMSGIVSAVLFIVEAGKTRSATARYNLDLLRRYGYENIRLILNKRVFYIPAWLMRFV